MPEEYRNLVNLVLRDHQGFTGDGHGGVGDLPIGDRSTARKPIEKRDLREVMLAADASVDAAIQAATDVHGASLFAADLPALLADTADEYPFGTIFATRAEGVSYEVVSDNPQMTTAGGVGLVEVGPRFSSRQRLADTVARNILRQGQIVAVDGIPAVVDSTATGAASALHDLGVDGVRLIGDVVMARWWTDGVAGDASAALTAANTYAAAVSSARAISGSVGVTLMVEGPLNLANPVTFGSSGRGFAVDTSSAVFNAIAGGSLTGSTYLVRIIGRDTEHRCGQILCNQMCSGWDFDGVTNSRLVNPVFRRPVAAGIRVRGNSAGATLEDPVGDEWRTTDPEFNVDASYVADGIRAESYDFRIVGGHVGWIFCPLRVVSVAGQVEVIGFHPYNGNPNEGFTRAHPWNVIIEEGAGGVRFHGCYFDNGYIDDRSGTMAIYGGNHYNGADRVVTTHPLCRIKQGSAGASSVRNRIFNYPGTVGIYTGSWINDFSNAIINVPSTAMGSAASGSSRTTTLSRRETRIIPNSEDTLDNLTAKQGGEGTVIRHRYHPGSEATSQLDVEIYLGRMRLQNSAGEGEIVLSGATRTGVKGTGNRLDVYTNGARRAIFPDNGGFRPATDNNQALGLGSARWSTVYAGTGTINTSDARAKTDVRDLSEAERAVAARVKGLIRAFRYSDAVDQKGDAARTHFGVLAQEVAEAFAAEGLDPMAYGIVCYDAWDDQPALVDEATGEVIEPARPAGDSWGIRYDELMAFLMAVS